MALTLDLPLKTSLVPLYAKGSPTPTYTRATVAYVKDWEGLFKAVLSGEARFQGARRVHNLIANPEDLEAAGWTVQSGATVTQIDGAEWEIDISGCANGLGVFFQVDGVYTATLRIAVSLYIPSSSGDGSINVVEPAASQFTPFQFTMTGSWQRLATPVFSSVGNVPGLWFQKRAGGATLFRVKQPQVENVGGQSNQSPSEYVSRGVLAAPYHGAGVDGVKYFPTLNANTVASNVVTEATGAVISSATGKYASAAVAELTLDCFSTPSSVANRILGDIDYRIQTALPNWATGIDTILMSKDSSGGNRGWIFAISAGTLYVYHSTTGTDVDPFTATATVSITAGAKWWVRFTWEATSGDLKFYHSEDGVTWAQVGATVSCDPGTTTYDNTVSVAVGGAEGGFYHVGPLPKIYKAQIYNGVNGTLAVNFDANDFASGSTWVASQTGETWTINGNAKVFGGSGSSSIAAPWNADGPYGYNPEGSRTNLCLQSQDFTTTWVNTNTDEPTTNNVAHDGTATADEIAATATADQAFAIYQGFTGLTADTVTACSVSLKPKTNVTLIQLAFDSDGSGADGFFCNFNISTGAKGTITALAAGTATAAYITPLPNGYYRCEIVGKIAVGTVGRFTISIIDTISAAVFEAANLVDNDSFVAWGAQVEVASFASSYIPTTTAAVTRNTDVLSYPPSSNASSVEGTAYCEFTTPGLTANPRLIGSGTGGETAISFNSATQLVTYNGIDATLVSPVGTLDNGELHKGASKWSVAGASWSCFLAGVKGLPRTYTNPVSLWGENITIGHWAAGAGNPHFGTIRNVRIYDHALSDLHIAALPGGPSAYRSVIRQRRR